MKFSPLHQFGNHYSHSAHLYVHNYMKSTILGVLISMIGFNGQLTWKPQYISIVNDSHDWLHFVIKTLHNTTLSPMKSKYVWKITNSLRKSTKCANHGQPVSGWNLLFNFFRHFCLLQKESFGLLILRHHFVSTNHTYIVHGLCKTNYIWMDVHIPNTMMTCLRRCRYSSKAHSIFKHWLPLLL